MKHAILLVLIAVSLLDAGTPRIEMKGIHLAGALTLSEDQEGWYEVSIQNDSGKAAVLTVDAVGCTAVTIREVQPAAAAQTPLSQSPINVKVEAGQAARVIYDFKDGCRFSGLERLDIDNRRLEEANVRIHTIAVLIQGRDNTKGISGTINIQRLVGDQLTTFPFQSSGDSKLHGRTRFMPAVGITQLENFGTDSATAQVCQQSYVSAPAATGSLLADIILQSVGSRIECVQAFDYVHIPARSAVVSLMPGPTPSVFLRNEANHRVLGAAVFEGVPGTTQTYRVNSSIRFEDVK
jgi:hypothetical protein